MNYKSDIEKLYKNIYSENNNEKIKPSIKDYTTLIYETVEETVEEKVEVLEEKPSGHGDVSKVVDMIKHALRSGTVKSVDSTTQGWLLKSAKDNAQCLIHRGEKSLHYLRRYLQKLDAL